MAAVQEKKVMRGILCAAAGGICWGFSGTCAQLLTSSHATPVPWIICVRLLAAAGVFIVVCLAKDGKSFFAVFRDVPSLKSIALYSLLGVLLTQISYFTTISYTNAGTGTVLERLGLLVIMAYVCLRDRRIPLKREAAGLVLAMAGTFFVATKGNIGSLAIPPEALFWGSISAFALAFYTLLPVQVLKKWGSLTVTALAMLFAGVIATAAVRPWTLSVAVTPDVVGVMVAMVLIGTVAAYVFYLQGITDAGPVRASLIGCVEPVSATLISAFWLSTSVVAADIVGMALILSMVFFVTQRTGGAEAAPASRFGGSSEDLPLFEGTASQLGYYRFRPGHRDDFEAIQGILDEGHAFMGELGVREGLKKYPSARRVMRSIAAGTCWVIEQDGGGIIGVFAVALKGDPHYRSAKGATWLIGDTKEGTDYAALHWVTVSARARRGGVGSFMLDEAEHIARAAGKRSIRLDTYAGNIPMAALLAKRGYECCQTICISDYLERDKVRVVYEKLL